MLKFRKNDPQKKNQKILASFRSSFELKGIDLNDFINSLDSFERKVFYSSLNNSLDTRNPLKINNFAYSIRELINIYLYRKSPNEDILNAPWFDGEEEDIQRQDRVKFLIQKSLSNEVLVDVLSSCPLEIGDLTKRFNKLFNKLNKFTHINKNSYDISFDDAKAYILQLFESISSLFTKMQEIEEQLERSLGSYIEDHLHDEIMSETIDAIDECSTHHLIEDTYIDEIIVTDFNNQYIVFNGSGEISVEQQYGSSADLRRGDGLLSHSSFPVEFSGRVLCSDFETVEIDPYIEVNNDFHYGIDRTKKPTKLKRITRYLKDNFDFQINNVIHRLKNRNSQETEIDFDDIL